MSEFRWKLTYGNQKETLTKDPKGWEEILLTHVRDEKYHGVFYEFSIELGFFCKGAGKELIDEAYETDGTEANVKLTLEAKCNDTWTLVYTGKSDFSTFRQEYINKTLYSFINFIKDGITETIRNREDVNIDITSDVSLDGTQLNTYYKAPYKIYCHSKLIKYKSEWQASECSQSYCGEFGSPFNSELSWGLGLVDKISDIKTTNSTNVSFSGNIINTALEPIIDTKNQNQNLAYPLPVVINCTFKGTYTDSAFTQIGREVDPDTGLEICGTGGAKNQLRDTNLTPVYLLLHIGEDASNFIIGQPKTYVICSMAAYNTFGTHTDNFIGSLSVNETLDKNDKIWLIWATQYDTSTQTTPTDIVWTWDYEIAGVNIILDTVTPQNQVRSVAIHEAWSRVAEGITNQTLAFKSELFGRKDSQGLSYDNNGCASYTAITNQLNLRVPPDIQEDNCAVAGTTLQERYVEPKIRTTLTDIFVSCNAIWNIGLGIEEHEDTEVVRVEGKEYFYSDDIIFTATDVANIKMELDTNLSPTEVEIGFQQWETEDINGADEPLTNAIYTLKDIKSYNNKQSYLSKYVASMYAIELARRYNKDYGTTTDNFRDQENFFIALNRTVDSNGIATKLDVPERDENIFVNPNTLISPSTAYNLRFMLSACYRRLANIIHVGLTKLAPSTIKATYDEGNPDAIYTNLTLQDNCTADEINKATYNVQDYEYDATELTPIYTNEIYKFDYPVSFSDYGIIRANPKGLIKFSDTNKNYKSGWIRNFQYNLRTKMGTFEIIRKYDE